MTTTFEPLTVSYSQIKVWQQCKRRWFWGYHENLEPLRKRDYFVMGSFIHEQLGKFYLLLREGESVSEARRIVLEGLGETAIEPDVDITFVARASRVLERYMREFSPQNDQHMTVLESEYHFNVLLHTPKGMPYYLQGYVDLVYEEFGKLWILDFKTSASKPYTDDDVLFDNQLLTYAAALERDDYFKRYKEPHGVAIQNLNTYDYKNFLAEPTGKLFSRVYGNKTAYERMAALMLIGEVVDEIYETVNYAHNFRRECKYCPFSHLCLLEIKGLPTDGYVEIGFQRRTRQEEAEGEEESALAVQEG